VCIKGLGSKAVVYSVGVVSDPANESVQDCFDIMQLTCADSVNLMVSRSCDGLMELHS